MKQMINVFLIGVILFQVISLSSLAQPLSLEDSQKSQLKIAAIKNGLGDPGEKILNAIVMTSKQTGLSQSFIISLMHSESSFNVKAISRKGYKGLMQIPQNVFYEDANTLIGANIFKEKLKITNGDYKKAVILYKGWELSHPEGRRQADKVIKLTMKMKEE